MNGTPLKTKGGTSRLRLPTGIWASHHGFGGGGWMVHVPFGATACTSHSALCARRLVEAGGVEPPRLIDRT
jgi:hypothetical protein